MTRHFLFAMLVLASALPASAQDGGVELAGPEAYLHGDATRLDRGTSSPNQSTREASAEVDEEPGVIAAPADEAAFESLGEPLGADGFYPICDCNGGCEVPGMDYWCDGCPSCCSTDMWCDHCCQDSAGTNRLLDDGTWMSDMGCCDVHGCGTPYYDSSVRFGWWSVGTAGSVTRIGEYQDLTSSPFWDVDTLRSDGTHTLDLVMSGLDNEANQARAQYYGPRMSANVFYQRFLRRWDHDPMASPDIGPPVPSQDPNDVISEDLNVGEDYAIRVQQLDARFKGNLTQNIKWKLNVWGMRKFGERQSNAVGHCYNINPQLNMAGTDNRCHVLSSRQNVDWLTMQLEPIIEARFDRFTVEYSHTVRSFSADDQFLTRQYSRFGYQGPGGSGTYGAPFEYATVPSNETHIDRLKISSQLNENNRFYGNLFVGNTHNEFRNTRRQFGGYDLRLTNTSIDRVTLTGYNSMYEENNQLPPYYFNSAPEGLGENATNVDHPFDYNRVRAGLKADWKPFDLEGDYEFEKWDMWDRLATMRLVMGYEFHQIARDYATYSSTRLGTFTQPDTKSHEIDFGPRWRWSPTVQSWVRYRGQFIEDPLVGVRESQGRFNTNLPSLSNRIEIGGTWTPTDNLMATVQLGYLNASNNSFYPSNAVNNLPIDFEENNFPLMGTIWWSPTERWSLTAAYAYFTNFIDQDITVGFRGPESPGSPFETTPWNYQGENQMVSLSSTYALTPCVNLIGGMEWNRGRNDFNPPPMTDSILLPGNPPVINGPGDWSTLPTYSSVLANTVRFTGGVDWQPFHHTTLYARYVYYGWDDLSQGTYTGRANMVLAGAQVIW